MYAINFMLFLGFNFLMISFLIANSRGLWYMSSNCYQKRPYICEIDINEPIISSPSTSK